MIQNQLISISLDGTRAPGMSISARQGNLVPSNLFPLASLVSNVGEFSRTILGSHFKHNNVSLDGRNISPTKLTLDSSRALFVS